MGTTAATLEAEHIFKVRNENKTQYLPEEQTQTFHHTVAQLLLISDRYRQYIQMVVEFLTACLKKPDKDDRVKLKSMLKYLKGKR